MYFLTVLRDAPVCWLISTLLLPWVKERRICLILVIRIVLLAMYECGFNTQPQTLMAIKTTSFKYSLGGGQFAPDLPGQFAPDLDGQLRAERGGHYHRIFQA